MEAGGSQQFGHVSNPEPLSYPHPILIIQAIVKRDVERADSFKRLSAKKHRWLANEAGFRKTLIIELLGRMALNNVPLRVRIVGFAIDHRDVKTLLKEL